MSLSAEQTAVIINALITAKATLRVVRRTGMYDAALDKSPVQKRTGKDGKRRAA